jgi:elongation factor Ts
MDCKKALEETGGNLEEAMGLLRKQNMAKAEKKASRSAAEGRVGVYQHHNGKGASLVEVNCETDFVARTDEFKSFLTELAQHVYAMNPEFVSRDQVGAERVAQEREIYAEQVKDKPEQVQGKIVEGKLGGFYKEICLLEQPFVKEPKKTVEQLLKEMIAQLGENMIIRRVARIEIGGE